MARFWPLARGFIVTSKFGQRGAEFHWGVDFGKDGGSGGLPVYAAQGGTVVNAGTATGFGQWVVIDHPTEDGAGTTVYGHVIPEVPIGRRVEAGQRIARINPDSNTNGGTAPHLHLEWHRSIWTAPGPNRLDPEAMLANANYPGEVRPNLGALTAETLAKAMGNSLTLDQYRAYLPTFTDAMRAANITNANRAAMWCAQLGHESAGLRYMEEIADGSLYEGRADLGNTQPGDGRRFKGRGPIQLTGRANYERFSKWCFDQGLVVSWNALVNQPELVSEPKWGFLAASWYWTVARPNLNAMADKGDLEGCTRAINGGLNGLADRQQRWTRCSALGDALLPPKQTQEAPVTAPDPNKLASKVDGSRHTRDDFLLYGDRYLWRINKMLTAICKRDGLPYTDEALKTVGEK